MTPEIKQRMAQIRRGEVPEGYKNTPVGVIPSNWKIQPLGMSCLIADGMHQTPQYTSQGVPFVSVENIGRIDGTNKFISRDAFDKFKIKPRENDIFMTRITAGIIGETEIIRASTPLAYYVSLALIRIIAPEEIDVIFLNHFINCHIFKKELYKRIIHTAFPKKINLNEIGECVTVIPPLGEQQKVASILTTQDKVIELKEKRLAEKHRQKKHLMQQLLTGKKRLPRFCGEWKATRLRNIATRHTKRNTIGNTNVLTISAQYGLINQAEFFNKVVASDDKSNYFLLQKGDFAYNKSYSNGYPFGAIKRLTRYEVGIVSPLYICFRIKEGSVSGEYLEQYFEAGLMNHEIQAFAQEGARNHGLLNIAVDDFFNSKILLPSPEEQTAIAEVLSASDREIDLLRQDIEHEKQKKKALMQLLLTGIVRVKT